MKKADLQKMVNLQNKARELRLEYMRNWRKNNRERLAQYERDYWMKKAERSLLEGYEDEIQMGK